MKKAIEVGIANGTLNEDLKDLGELKLKSRSDAKAVCWGLQQLAKGRTQKLGDIVHALASLLLDVESAECDAAAVLSEEGIPELLRLFDEMVESPEEDDTNALFLILKVLGLYGTTNGTLKIVEAARKPFNPSGYMWSVILGGFKTDHPEAALLYSSLSDPLPPDFIGISLLDAANAYLIEGGEMSHPFDTSEGKQRLRTWLTSSNPDQFSYAHSVASSLPFLGNSFRDELLDLAIKHPDEGVRIAGAWVAAKVGLEDGLRRLADYCLDFKHATRAIAYLEELNREDMIPVAAKEPGFVALAEFAQWLAHPCELGRLPDHLEIVDHRDLVWPPERVPKPFWLIKYRVSDTTGLEDDDEQCGLVGSVTFCLFSYGLAQRPPEDAYAIHCYWEMEQTKLIEESDVQEDFTEYQSLIKQWHGGPLENPQVLFLAELSPELQYAQCLVGLASARYEDEDGWVVLDGDRSEWYPKSDMPMDVRDSTVLKVHVGRQLLGFKGKPDRRKYLADAKPPKSPDAIITAFSKLLSEAQKLKGEELTSALDIHGPVGKHADKYINALRQTGRDKEVIATIHFFTPHWDHNLGYATLGKQAFRSGGFDLAESFLGKGQNNPEEAYQVEDKSMLAEIWLSQGKVEEALKLLLDSLRTLIVQSQGATGSDKIIVEEGFQAQRNTFLRLFSTEGHAVLKANGIPTTTLL